MGITHQVEKWLREEGAYENHCFVSWPHTINRDITECAQSIRRSILEELATSFHDPQVFLDDSEICCGTAWEMRLRRALCKSVSMVAICAPIYYRPEHQWCGLEWAAMEHLSSIRLPGRDLTAIIPVMVRRSDPLPSAISGVQYIDFSRVTIQGRRYFTFPEFRRKIHQIVTHIELVAEELWRNNSRANCDLFQFPSKSAFSDYTVPAQRFPLVN
jgi:hypothetical protein